MRLICYGSESVLTLGWYADGTIDLSSVLPAEPKISLKVYGYSSLAREAGLQLLY